MSATRLVANLGGEATAPFRACHEEGQPVPVGAALGQTLPRDERAIRGRR